MFLKAQVDEVRVNKYFQHFEHLSSSRGLCASLQNILKPWDEQGIVYFNQITLECWIVAQPKVLLQMPLNRTAKWLVTGDGMQLQVVHKAEDLRAHVDRVRKQSKTTVIRRLKDPLLGNKNATFLLQSRVLVTSAVPLRAFIHDSGSLSLVHSKRLRPRVQEWTHVQFEELLGSTAWEKVKQRRNSAIAKVLLVSERKFSKAYSRLQTNFTCAHCFQQLAVDMVVTEQLNVHVVDIHSVSLHLQKGKEERFQAGLRRFEEDSIRLLFGSHKLEAEVMANALRAELNLVKYADLRKGEYTPIIDISLQVFFKWLDPGLLSYVIELHNEVQRMGRFTPLYPPLKEVQSERTRAEWKLYLGHLGFTPTRIKFHMLLNDLEPFFMRRRAVK